MGLPSMSMTTSPWAAAIIATAKVMQNIYIYNRHLSYEAKYACETSVSVDTSSRHADFIVKTIRVTAELLQTVNRALPHDRLPTKRSVVDHLEHDGRGVHLIFGKKLSEQWEDRPNKEISKVYIFEGVLFLQGRLGVITTLSSSTDPGKLGFFLKFLITAVWTVSPPHSTIKLGDDTVANWYVFMFLNPQVKTYKRKQLFILQKLAGADKESSTQEGLNDLKIYLNRSELHNWPDSLRNHVEILPPPRRHQWKISIINLEDKNRGTSFIKLPNVKLQLNHLILVLSVPCPSIWAQQLAMPLQHCDLFWWLGTTAV